VPTTRRSRTIAASPEELWKVIGDAHHLPRWWPRIQRVEAVAAKHWTEVMLTKKGRALRADQRLEESRTQELRRWTLEIEDSPFEKVLAESTTEVRLEPADGGTRVTIELYRGLKGMGRLGGFLFRRAARSQLDEALDGLERACGP
jgi:uncharacterized protein YndB with AHSA1/START domain